MKKHYDIKFLDDFKDILEGVNVNYYGMIGKREGDGTVLERLLAKPKPSINLFTTDQLVASRGRLFFGCWHST